MLKALFWKEWRESRLLLVIGLLLIAGISLCLLYPHWGLHIQQSIQPYFSLSEILSLFCFPLCGFAILFGARAFSTEEEKLLFILSKPVKKQTIVTIKIANGLLNILILSLIPGIIFWTAYIHEAVLQIRNFPVPYSTNSAYVGYGVFTIWFFYVISFFMSSLFLNVTTSILIGFFGTGFIYSSSDLLLRKFGWSDFHPFLLSAFSLLFLLLSYFIFMRREVRH